VVGWMSENGIGGTVEAQTAASDDLESPQRMRDLTGESSPRSIAAMHNTYTLTRILTCDLETSSKQSKN
jgi:hypothetical protein